MHLPCLVFSCKQLDLFLWLLQVNNVNDDPSTKSLKTLNKILQNTCSIDTLAYEGKLGHHYHVNNMSQILAQVNFCSVIVCKSSEIWLRNFAIQKFDQIFIFTLKILANSPGPVQQPESEKNLIWFFQIFVTQRDCSHDLIKLLTAWQQGGSCEWHVSFHSPCCHAQCWATPSHHHPAKLPMEGAIISVIREIISTININSQQ